MSYSILYNKQFIKVDDNHIIVITEQGDNNVWECDNKRRARDWGNCYAHSDGAIIVANDKLLADIDAFRQTTMERCEEHVKQYNESWAYDDKRWGYHTGLALYGKSTRNTTFGAYKGFYQTGIKQAMTIEELVKLGVSVKLYPYRWVDKDILDKGLEIKPDVWFSSTEQMVEKIKEYSEYYKGEVTLYLNVYSMDRVLFNRKNDRIMAKSMKRKDKQELTVNEYFVLAYGESCSFIKRTKFGFSFSYTLTGGKAFMTEKQANAFFKRMPEYKDRFTVKKVEGERTFLK